MVDRVAGKICIAVLSSLDSRDLARAAIAALREPTAAMLQAWDVANIQGPQDDKWKQIVWRAMIDAALTE